MAEAKLQGPNRYELALRKIGERRWETISEGWLPYVPDSANNPISAFEPYTSSDPTLAALDAAYASADHSHESELPVVRTLLFAEGVYYLVRALNILSASERGARIGYPTAGSTTAYLASYLAMRAFLAFLGLGYTEHKSRAYIFDVWPELGVLTGQGNKRPWIPRVRFCYCGERFNHQKHWDLFLHLVRRLRQSPLPLTVVDFFRKMKDHAAFSGRRNAVQYQGAWPFNDLFVELEDEGIGVVRDFPKEGVDAVSLDYVIAQSVVLSGVVFFSRVAKLTPKLNARSAEIKSVLQNARHPIFSSGQWWNELPKFG